MLQETLADYLCGWADTYGDELSKNQIVNATPERLREQIRNHAPLDTRGTLILAVELCRRADGEDGVLHLAALFANMASTLWPALQHSPGGTASA